MTVEHEQRCERTIASVVHEIDDLKHQLAESNAAIDRATALCRASLGRRWSTLTLEILAALETP